MGTREKKIEAVNAMMQAGKIKKISELFEVLPAYHVTSAWGMNAQTLSKRITNPRYFKLGELADLAEFIGVDITLVLQIAVNSLPEKKRKTQSEKSRSIKKNQ